MPKYPLIGNMRLFPQQLKSRLVKRLLLGLPPMSTACSVLAVKDPMNGASGWGCALVINNELWMKIGENSL